MNLVLACFFTMLPLSSDLQWIVLGVFFAVSLIVLVSVSFLSHHLQCLPMNKATESEESHVPCSWAECRTGNQEELSNSQVELNQAINFIFAYFYSFSCDICCKEMGLEPFERFCEPVLLPLCGTRKQGWGVS